jgi:putative transcriptional regulator
MTTRRKTPRRDASPADANSSPAPRGNSPTAKLLRDAVPGIDNSPLTGQVLIAMPAMGDPRFEQSVIYLCAHTPEGAMGLIVNRPLASPSFDDLLRQLKIDPVPPARSMRLYAGGPVDNSRGFVLHTTDWTAEASLRVNSDLALTASLDILKAVASGGGPKDSILALGYAGWGAGQLDTELQQNAWLTAPADHDVLFDGAHETKWRRALAKLRIDPLLLSTAAGRA